MRYDIRLLIEYDYPAASDHVRNVLRLAPPMQTGRQKTESCALTITPAPDERRDLLDYFGNAMPHVAWHRPMRHLSFHLHAVVERFALAELDLSLPLDQLTAQLTQMDARPSSPMQFTAASPRIESGGAIAEFAQGVVEPGLTTFAIVQRLGEALHACMQFDATATDAATPPQEAFANRRGVCQDFAQIMIAGLRAIGIPAGYVSGFLRTTPPPGQPRLAGVDAMHAWVTAWCGAQQGWVEYDPTNRQWAGEDYVSVAWGRDYADAAPVRGAIRTSGGQQSGHKVDVIALPKR